MAEVVVIFRGWLYTCLVLRTVVVQWEDSCTDKRKVKM